MHKPQYNSRVKGAIIDRFATQQEFSRKLGIDVSLVSRYIRGWRNPDAPTRKRICELLNMHEAELFPLV